MKLTKVKSSNIAKLGYDEKTKTIRVVFLNGGIYDYSPCTQKIFLALKSAESIGKYFNANIKDNKNLQFKKIDKA